MKYFFLFIKKLLRFLLKPLSFLPAVLMMCVIIGFSSQDAETSGALSENVTQEFVEFCAQVLDRDWSDAQIVRYAGLLERSVRKAAHVTEYFFLAVTLTLPLYVYRLRGWPLVVTVVLFCAAFAGLDEFHQSFVPGRSPAVTDVGIDTLGSLAGIYVTRFFCWLGRKTIFRMLAS